MATRTLPPTTYPEEPKEYITSTTINLKPCKRPQSLNCCQLLENLTFEWHTNVNTPPNTPVVPIVQKPVHHQPNNTHNNNNKHHMPHQSRDLFLPAFTYEEEDNLPTKVDKFMACERYHSQYQQALAKRTTNL